MRLSLHALLLNRHLFDFWCLWRCVTGACRYCLIGKFGLRGERVAPKRNLRCPTESVCFFFGLQLPFAELTGLVSLPCYANRCTRFRSTVIASKSVGYLELRSEYPPSRQFHLGMGAMNKVCDTTRESRKSQPADQPCIFRCLKIGNPPLAVF